MLQHKYQNLRANVWKKNLDYREQKSNKTIYKLYKIKIDKQRDRRGKFYR